MTKTLVSGALYGLILLTIPASASVIYTYDANNPITGAGPLPASAQSLAGEFPDTIFGNFGPDLNAVNVFGIDILKPADFSALTTAVSHGAPDTELFLFNSTGLAVYANDDISLTNTLSCLPSLDMANPCPSSPDDLGPVTAGLYYLAITRSNQMPWDSHDNYLFTNTFDSTDVMGPNPAAGGADPAAGWDGGAYTNPNFDNSYYEVSLTGTVPEPGTFLMLACGIAFGLLLRRKKTA